MYDFAIVALLALATLKLADYVTDVVEPLRKWRSLLTFVIAVGATVLLDYSVFSAWDVGIRNDDVGTWVTGFMVAGLTVPWRALFGYLTHDRAATDETLGDTAHIRAA
jgi:branched-subunit amino acid ABC-type transport system permease component